jgi:hypothetical protein
MYLSIPNYPDRWRYYCYCNRVSSGTYTHNVFVLVERPDIEECPSIST